MASGTPRSFHNDEATGEDSLNRLQYARALAEVARTGGTPLVIGLYGTWGTGKTSLMRQIQAALTKSEVPIETVWFDAWQHQFDESPALSLMHTVVNTFQPGEKFEKGKKALAVIATAWASAAMKTVTAIDAKDLQEFGKRYEDERFQVRDARVRLREHFEQLIKVAQTSEKNRIVFFIDDLDRCLPKQTLEMLEALKLYLNLKNCMFFLGVDPKALERSIRHHYKDGYKEGEFSEVSYLDKIVQLPFHIPPIDDKDIGGYIDNLLPKELQPCRELLIRGLGDNPRAVKRFINSLLLNHLLAKEASAVYKNDLQFSKVLALVLLIQMLSPTLYARITKYPELIRELKDTSEERKALREKWLDTHEGLKSVFDMIDIPTNLELKPFIFLTQAARVTEAAANPHSTIDLLPAPGTSCGDDETDWS